jgi:hypothetical protein
MAMAAATDFEYKTQKNDKTGNAHTSITQHSAALV